MQQLQFKPLGNPRTRHFSVDRFATRAFQVSNVALLSSYTDSKNTVGTNSRKEIESAREMVARHFNANYHVVFTSGATAGCKLLADLFPWESDQSTGRMLFYAASSHNSVVGMRKCAPQFVAFDSDFLTSRTLPPSANDSVAQGSLVCFPAQCNFSGTKYALENVSLWQSKGFRVLLDAAALVGTSPLDLSQHTPDYVVLSFYKMFGYPTGLGALLILKTSAASDLLLNKGYFGGGTVGAVLYDKDWAKLRERLEESLEDGTANFQSIASLKHGFAALNKYGTMEAISRHVFSHAHLLARLLAEMRHWNGAKVVEIYGWSESELSTNSLAHLAEIHNAHGGVVTLSIRRSDGSWVGHNEVDRLASQEGFQLRTGCFCNPGACQKFLKLTSETIVGNYERGHRCWDDNDVINGLPTGAVRVSFPYFCKPSHAVAFASFIRQHFVESVHPVLAAVDRSNSVESTAKLDKICVFPIKSCGGFEVDEWNVTSEGLEYDREWMLVDREGRFVNQKAEPKLSLVSTKIEARVLSVSAPGMPLLHIDVDDIPDEELDLQVCGDVCSGRVYPKSVSEWFRSFLGSEPLLLVRNAPDSDRKAKSTSTSSDSNELVCDKTVRFVNESQFLIVNRSSMDDLKTRLIASSVEESDRGGENKEDTANKRLSNMRWNLCVDGTLAYDEDLWISLSIGPAHRLVVSGDCARCRMINIDPETGLSCREPLHTLSTFRRKNGRVVFGVLAVLEPLAEPLPIRVGMPVTIHSRSTTDELVL